MGGLVSERFASGSRPSPSQGPRTGRPGTCAALGSSRAGCRLVFGIYLVYLCISWLDIWIYVCVCFAILLMCISQKMALDLSSQAESWTNRRHAFLRLLRSDNIPNKYQNIFKIYKDIQTRPKPRAAHRPAAGPGPARPLAWAGPATALNFVSIPMNLRILDIFNMFDMFLMLFSEDGLRPEFTA